MSLRLILAWVILAAAIPALPDTAAWVESSGTMMSADRPAGTAKSIERSGVRNEYVTAQIGLRASTDAEPALSFEWTALSSAEGKEIAKDNVALYRAADIEVDHGQKVDAAKDPARARAFGKYPDALVPLVLKDGTNVANSIKPAKDATIPLWVDVFIPAGTGPGEYSGAISLKSGPRTLATIPVKLKVLELEISADSTVPSLFNLRMHDHVIKNLDNYVTQTLRHRVQPTNYHWVEYALERPNGWEMMDRLNPNGKGYVNVYFSQTSVPKDPDAFIANLKKIAEHLRQRGLFERSYIYLKDEPDAKEIPGVVEVGKLIIERCPEWKGRILCTCSPKEGTGLEEVLSIHAEALKSFGPWYVQSPPAPRPDGRGEWDKRRVNGQKLWFYVSNAQGTPYPTFDVHTVMGWEPRVMGWAFWYEKAEGHLYWDLMFEPKWRSHPKFPPGDGQLIYPGDFAGATGLEWVQVKDIQGPVVSRRLKMLREGLEEWELLKMAEAKVGRDKVAPVVEKVYTCMGRRTWAPDAYDPRKPMWSYSEADWDAARQAVIDLLLKK